MYPALNVNHISTILFDCDGTLVDSEHLGNEVLAGYACELGARLTAEEAVAAFRGRKMADCVAELESMIDGSLPEDFVPELRRRTADAFRQRLRPVDGAIDLVVSLIVPFCVASSGPREKIELALDVTGLLPYFAGRIFSSYEVGAWKPDPGLLLHAAHAMGARPEECLVVEDSLPGIRAGLAAGMNVVALQMGEADAMIPREVHIIRHLSELPAIVPGIADSP
jgi:HAD superfamily hydrolase (TIGR01509 family)